jgi:sugar lactone lactonase YvrE
MGSWLDRSPPGNAVPTVLDVAVAGPAILGEGPVWDARRGELLWVDIVAGAVNAYAPETGATRRIELGENVGCIALTHDAGTVVGALRSGWCWVDLEGGTTQPIAPLPGGAANQRFNDGAVDTLGRFWTGTLEDGEENPVGGLFRLDTDLRHRLVDRGFFCSNGLAWSLDDRWLYFVDSGRAAIFRYPFDAETGAVGERELFLDTTAICGIPDGIEIDLDGLLWCAFWDGAQVVAFDESGTPRIEVPVPAPRPTSIAFGGPDLCTLFVTSATYGLPPDTLAEWPHAGSVFQIERPTPGRPANVFGGVPWAS